MFYVKSRRSKTKEAEELYALAESKDLVLLEAIKTAYSPGFLRLVSLARSGVIGNIKHVDATFTKLSSGDLRELKAETAGGSMTELASYPLLAIVKLLGLDIKETSFTSFFDKKEGIDLFTHMTLHYNKAIATAKVGLGVKSEGHLDYFWNRGLCLMFLLLGGGQNTLKYVMRTSVKIKNISINLKATG